MLYIAVKRQTFNSLTLYHHLSLSIRL